ncbi:MAG: hypothetical protein NTV86_07415 [Planctomycetota bacterium]|nr:hypothetical protein [Planctomycetota bacterium]
MMRIKIGLIVAGIALTYIGYREWRLANKAGHEKQALTCAQLTKNGCGDNANVTVRDAVVLPTWFVYEGKGEAGPWTTVWVPLVPKDGQYMQDLRRLVGPDDQLPANLPPPTDIRLVLRSGKVSDMAGMDRLARETVFDGMIVNEIEKLEGKERQLLEKGFPGTDFSQCYILHHGRTPASKGKLFALLIGGLAALGLGGFWLLAGWMRGKPTAVASPAAPTPTPPAPPPTALPADDDHNPYAQERQ